MIELTIVLKICILLIFFYVAYLRIQHPFWIKQPVFHFYDLYYWIYDAGIINQELPKCSPYTNFLNIVTKPLTNEEMSNFTDIIQKNYLQNKENSYDPSAHNIAPYFPTSNTFISFYYPDHQTSPAGVITGRPMEMIIGAKKLDIYYVDFLCVKKNHRKKNVAAQLIQTHEYYQRRLNPNICVSVFKREEELTAIVPITTFQSYCFNWNSTKITNLISIPKRNLLTGTPQNIKYFCDWVKSQMNSQKLMLIPQLDVLINLVVSKNIYIEMLMEREQIQAAFIFKKSCVCIKNNKEILNCMCSIKDSECQNTKFIEGFIQSTNKIIENDPQNEGSWNKKTITHHNVYDYVAIEEIADNNIIGNFLKNITKPIISTPNAYFFYNYAHHTFPSNRTIIIT